MKYRTATLKDKEGIAEVLFKNYNIKTKKVALRVAEEELTRGFHYIVAEKDGKIVGIASWQVNGLPKHQLTYCSRVAVLPEFKGKSVAKTLFEKMVQDADRFYKSKNLRMRKMYAFVHSSNKLAHRFYKNRGFIHEATLKDHYYKGEDEWIYSMFFE